MYKLDFLTFFILGYNTVVITRAVLIIMGQEKDVVLVTYTMNISFSIFIIHKPY